MNKKYLLLLLILVFVLSGCAARTRLGELIPAHTASEKLNGEMVTAKFIPFKLPDENEQKASFVPLAAAASAVTGVLVDVLRNEALREAERYEHQYSTKLFLTTSDIGEGGIILITRWVDDPDSPSCSSENKSPMVPEFNKQIHKTAVLKDKPEIIQHEIDTILKAGPEGACGKIAVAALALGITHEKGSVYRLSEANLKLTEVGAKVVDFGLRNIPRIWQWPGAIIFATNPQMRFSAAMSTKALIVGKYDDNKNPVELKWLDINLESDPLGSLNINLDKLPIITSIGSTLGSWLPIPTIGPKEAQNGYIVMSFNFTESDSSNAKKYLKQAADSLEKNKDSIIDQVRKIIGDK